MPTSLPGLQELVIGALYAVPKGPGYAVSEAQGAEERGSI